MRAEIETASLTIFSTLIFGFFVSSAAAIVWHFVVSPQSPLSAPDTGSTYATLLSSPHTPFGKHTFDAQSVFCAQLRHKNESRSQNFFSALLEHCAGK